MTFTQLALLIMLTTIQQMSTHPVIHDQSQNLQSFDGSSQKKITIPDVATTITEVHKMLQEDPTLPRLTRGEIEDLFEQVTKEEYVKSIKDGDINRANNMRALMLVLPYNIDNNTEENLQELYTRPPVTKVIDSYSVPQPQKFQTPAQVSSGKVDIVDVGNLVATTYKPRLQLKEHVNPNPTTYHPTQTLLKMTQMGTTSLPLLPDIEEDPNKSTRFSSSYNAKDTEWALLEGEANNRNKPYKKFTPMQDFSELFQNFGLTMQNQAHTKLKLEDYSQVGRPPMSSSIKQSERFPATIDIADFTRTLPPRPNTEAYSQFKPLNIGEEIRIQPEIEQYLNRYGIVNRKRKQIKPEDEASPKPIDTTLPTSTKPTVPSEDQIIKRIDINVDDTDTTNTQDQKDFLQLNKLLTNLRELERLNVSLTADMLKAVDLGNFNLSNKIRAQGPDPVINAADSNKNDIKRQSATDTISSPTRINLDLDLISKDDSATSSTASTTEETTSTTEEPRNGSLADLEDSFGGPDPITEDPNPPPKKNGFYFLADWNSFLEVGEAGNDQVVVRFDPKIGDPRRFLKVTVP